jgi:SAM-dependent methyltransferase
MTVIDQVLYDLMYRISKPVWDDSNIPAQVAQLAVHKGKTRTALDLGCGTGTHSIYLAQQGFHVTAVDISPTAIRRARDKADQAKVTPEFFVHDVTNLDFLGGPFDIALDVGCFHALNTAGQRCYASELTRLMRPGGILLLWGMDDRPLGLGRLSPEIVEKIFTPGFRPGRAEDSQMHKRQSKWYWLDRK